ncbi:MAG: dTMP kinase [Pseudomonadota bacterium]
MPSVFITLEGGEGAGKSTLLKGLVPALVARGIDVVATREPGGSPLAETVRSLVLNPPAGEDWSPMAEALLMNAARSDHIDKVIGPSLAAGKAVISDRYSDSTRVYQAAGAGVPRAHLLAMEEIVTADARPDLTLILDAAPEDLLARRQDRNAPTDAFESRDLAFHTAIRNGFLAIAEAEPERCLVLNAMAQPARILERALGAIDNRLRL